MCRNIALLFVWCRKCVGILTGRPQVQVRSMGRWYLLVSEVLHCELQQRVFHVGRTDGQRRCVLLVIVLMVRGRRVGEPIQMVHGFVLTVHVVRRLGQLIAFVMAGAVNETVLVMTIAGRLATMVL